MAETTPPIRSSRDVVRGRARGIVVGTLIGAGWAAWGMSPATATTRTLIGVPVAIVILALLAGARRLFVLAHDLPAPDDAARAINRRVWMLFWLNLVIEIVLLNVAVDLLSAAPLRIYWIPAISFVVGLHFIPMAFFFRVRSHLACAAAMMVASIAIALGIASYPTSATVLASVEALLNAAILWATAAWGFRGFDERLRRPRTVA